MKTWLFGWITLLALALLGADAWWISGEAQLPGGSGTILVWQWLAALATLLLVSGLAGYVANGRIAGVLIDERNRISLARFQWVAWFLVLLSGYFTGSVWNAAYISDLPGFDANLFGVIGIVSASAVVSGVVVDAKKHPAATVPADAVQNPIAPAAADPTLIGRIDKNVAPSEAGWADLYLGEEEATRMSVDVSRLQKLVATILLVIVYFQMLRMGFIEAAANYKAFDMPIVGTNFVTLLGASHAAYLASKAAPKTPSV